MVRYFKKFDTRVKVMAGAGFPIPFEEVYDDKDRLFEWGVLQTSDGYLIGELENCIRRQVGGIAEIGAEEYDALKKKEHQTLLPSWRQAVARPHIVQILRDAAAEAAAVDKPKLPEIFRNLGTEMQKLTRPLGTVTGYKPATVTR